jgi:hypothetical protein
MSSDEIDGCDRASGALLSIRLVQMEGRPPSRRRTACDRAAAMDRTRRDVHLESDPIRDRRCRGTARVASRGASPGTATPGRLPAGLGQGGRCSGGTGTRRPTGPGVSQGSHRTRHVRPRPGLGRGACTLKARQAHLAVGA